MKKRIVLFAISFSLLAGLIYFSNPWKVAGILSEAKLPFVFLGLTFWFLSCLARTHRWRYLLKKVDIDVGFLKTMKYYITGLFISNLSPGKTADPVRAVFLKKEEGESFSSGVGSIFVERVFDLIAMCTVAIVGLFWLAASYSVVRWVALGIGVYVFLISFGIYLVFSEDKLERFLGKLVSILSFLPKVEKLGERVEEFSEKLRSSLRKYKSKKTLFITLLLSILVWILNGFIAWMAFLALGFEIPLVMAITIKTSVILLAFLTFLPGSLGSGEVIGVSLYKALGVGITVAGLTSRAILGRFINFWVYAVVGAILLMTFKEKILSFDGL